jgi:benzoylformate decarboxylase
MATVSEVTLDLLRALGITTVFGNPGSTELPFLTRFPRDFRYVLGLQEASVVAMADGYAQASGQAVVVNVHTAAGMGNAMGTIVTAYHNRSPLIITAGQQVRAMMALEPLLLNRDAIVLPQPYVKWSHEPARAEDVPGAFLRAYHTALQNPPGPVFLSIPMDDWNAEAEPLATRVVSHRAAPDPRALAEAADLLRASERPALVLGAAVDQAGGWNAAVALAERTRAAVWSAPVAGRATFPEDHPLFQGALPPAAGQLAPKLAGNDVVVVVGAPVFTYYPYVPGPAVVPGTKLVQLTDDPYQAARAPMGTSIVGDVALALEGLVELVLASDRPAPPPRPLPAPPAPTSPMTPAYVFATLARVLPDDAVIVQESPSNIPELQDHVRVRRSGGYYTAASGGLGFGLPASVGVQLAQPERRVVCVMGDGSTMYSPQAFYTAARYGVPVVFLVLENAEYAILKWFAAFEGVDDIPGLDLPGLDVLQVARGCGCEGQRVEQPEALGGALERALASQRPSVVAVPITPRVPTLLAPPSPSPG